MYRNLTKEQFQVVKDTAAEICTRRKMKTIGEYKRMGNIIIDKIESGEVKWEDLSMALRGLQKYPIELLTCTLQG